MDWLAVKCEDRNCDSDSFTVSNIFSVKFHFQMCKTLSLMNSKAQTMRCFLNFMFCCFTSTEDDCILTDNTTVTEWLSVEKFPTNLKSLTNCVMNITVYNNHCTNLHTGNNKYKLLGHIKSRKLQYFENVLNGSITSKTAKICWFDNIIHGMNWLVGATVLQVRQDRGHWTASSHKYSLPSQ